MEKRGYAELTLEDALDLARRRAIIRSGSVGIDSLLGGGYRTGEMVQAFGQSNTGKTQLALQAALSASGAGLGVVFVDTEATFRPERLAKMAALGGFDPDAILSRVFAVRAETTSRQIQIVTNLTLDERVRESRLVVVDSVSKNFTLEYGGERRVLARQSLLSVYLNGMARDAFVNDRAVLLTNRVAAIAGGTRTEVAVGGRTLKRFLAKSIHLRRLGAEVSAARVSGDIEGPIVRCRLNERGLE